MRGTGAGRVCGRIADASCGRIATALCTYLNVQNELTQMVVESDEYLT